MERLNHIQIKMLKIISKSSPLPYVGLTEKEKSVCDFLEELGYISSTAAYKTGNDMGFAQLWLETESVSITELGKAYLAWLRMDRFRFTVPNLINTVLSIIAILISVIALLKP